MNESESTSGVSFDFGYVTQGMQCNSVTRKGTSPENHSLAILLSIHRLHQNPMYIWLFFLVLFLLSCETNG